MVDLTNLPKHDPDNAVISFGKYKGKNKTPNDLMQDDPQYVCWLYENVGKHICSRELYLTCASLRDEDDCEIDFDDVDSIYARDIGDRW